MLPRRPIQVSRRAILIAAIAASVLAHAAILGSFARTRRPPNAQRVDVDSAATQLVFADVASAPIPVPPPTPPTPEPDLKPPAPEPEPDTPTVSIAPPIVAAATPRPLTPAASQPVATLAPPSTTIIPPPTAPATPSFAGVAGVKASRIIYILDCSGPMTSSLPWVKEQLLASVAALRDGQSFRVLVCRRKGDTTATMVWNDSSDSTNAFSQGGLRAIAPLREWLDSFPPELATDTPAALRAAFAQSPELVFVLTRSIRRSITTPADADAILADLDRANPGAPGERRSVVRILQFVDEDPTGLLRAIATSHGDGPGSYRVMTEDRISTADSQ